MTVLLQLGDSLPGRVDQLKRLVRFVEQSARPLHGAVDLVDGPASRIGSDVSGSSFHELPFLQLLSCNVHYPPIFASVFAETF